MKAAFVAVAFSADQKVRSQRECDPSLSRDRQSLG